jgi:peptidyl-prolyl cis-trans isomerase C
LKLLRDPLVHFTLVAALVFAAHAVWQARTARAATTITVTASEIERMAALYTSEAGALPGEADMAAMLSDHVRDEALAREARRLGLDRSDTIITRRLAQKMSFVVSDLQEDPIPTEQDLRDWHAAHADRFTQPATLTFSHVYFSPDVRGADATSAAEETLQRLNGPTPPLPNALGDPFMLQRQYGDIPYRELARQFGGAFADALTTLSGSENWQGPVPSAYGLHLVRITRSTPATLSPFKDVEPDVRKDWLEQKRRDANEQAIQDIIGHYAVEIEGVD